MQPTPATASSSKRIGDVQVRPCVATDLPALSQLTAPGFGALLKDGLGEGRPDLCHLGAWIDGIPAGLLLSRRAEDNPQEQELLSLMVVPLLRRQGVASRLLADWSALMVAAGRSVISAQWSDRLPRGEDFMALLQASGWGESRRARLRMTFHVSDRHDALPHADRLARRLESSGLLLRDLSSLSAMDLQQLEVRVQRGLSEGTLPAWANPAPWLTAADQSVSQLIVDSENAVRGWLLCQQQPALQRWMVPLGWLDSELGGGQVMLAAMVRLLERLEQAHGAQAVLLLQPSVGAGARVGDLLDRRFRHHALWADRLLESRRPLDQPSGFPAS